MKRRVVEATAPTRVDLAGGVPVSAPQRPTSAVAGVGVAVDRRVWCRVETGVDGVEIESKDALLKVSAGTVAEAVAGGQLALAAHALQALGVETGVRVAMQVRVREETGLAAGSALAVALVAATAAALGRELAVDETLQLARAVEARARGVAGAVADYLPAIVGGTCCVHATATGARLEPLAVDPGRVEECLLLVDSGSASSGSGGDGPGRRILRAAGAEAGPQDDAAAAAEAGASDHEPAATGAGLQHERYAAAEARAQDHSGGGEVHESLARIGCTARGVREALLAGRYEDVAGLLAEEWDATLRLVPAPAPEVQRVLDLVRSAGGAAKPLAAGSGRIVLVWAPPGERGPGRREAVLEAARAGGLRAFTARVDMRGLELEAGA